MLVFVDETVSRKVTNKAFTAETLGASRVAWLAQLFP